MKELKCPNCGAPINRATMKCEYCGAVFEQTPNALVVVEHPKIIPLQACVEVDHELAQDAGIERYIVNEIARELVDRLVDYMDVRAQEDPYRRLMRFMGRVRVVPPNVRL